jgi:homogentisate 1,2-dioxygenase
LPDNPDTEATFLPLNPRVHISPTQLAWHPFEIPSSENVDFISGLKTVAGSGDPTLREGLATHVYTANTSMTQKAFVNSDGEMLIVPQQGALDIQTEFGPLFVQPGEIVVIPRGIRFRVQLPDGPSRGYILEIWGSYYELPELGPLGANGLANARDFLAPEAKYEILQEPWEIVYKLGGKFFASTQNHSPFDVVAWHGNYVCLPLLILFAFAAQLTRTKSKVPYKYDLTKFVNVGSISVDHIDPSIFCVLTAKSRDLTAPLADFLIFSPRWDVASRTDSLLLLTSRPHPHSTCANDRYIDTYRPPYYHRNAASELMGLVYGDYGGRSDAFKPGSISFECGSKSPPPSLCALLHTFYCRDPNRRKVVPHGVAYEEFKAASENPPPVMRISEASIAFMFESSRAFTITDYAWNSEKRHEHEPAMWDSLVDNFSKHKDEVEELLARKAKGLRV